MVTPLKAPFWWFGGKSRVAHLVWDRFGDVPNFVEPFAGSLAVLLNRPHEPRTETVNDKDCFLANLWRALVADPDSVAEHADWPVNECDLLARHRWLIAQGEFIQRMRTDPGYFDAKIAGWWVWGLSAWIGSGWCAKAEPSEQLPHLSSDGMGVHRPHLGDAGRGINRKLPHLGDAGRGINRKLPHLGDAGMGVNRETDLQMYFRRLAARLRRVRVACGEWDRVLGDSVTVRHGMTGIFLDSPYPEDDHVVDYSASSGDIWSAVQAWAIANGDNPLMRIALCGYEGQVMPESWECLAWKAAGGYGSQGDGQGRENASRERIWFSPACLKPRKQGSLFESFAS